MPQQNEDIQTLQWLLVVPERLAKYALDEMPINCPPSLLFSSNGGESGNIVFVVSCQNKKSSVGHSKIGSSKQSLKLRFLIELLMSFVTG